MKRTKATRLETDGAPPPTSPDLHAIAAHVRDVIYRYRVRPTCGLEYVNDASAQITGYTPQELYADPDPAGRLIHPGDRDLLAERIALGPPPEQIVLRWRHKDGSTIWMEQRETAIRDDDGNLVAIEGVARRLPEPTRGEIATIRLLGGLRINLIDRDVHVDGKPVHLSPSEFTLLTVLTESPGKVVSRRELMRRLWRSQHTGDAHVCETHISSLRQKIEQDPRIPERIRTVRGRGYTYAAT